MYADYIIIKRCMTYRKDRNVKEDIYHINEHKEFHTCRLKSIGNNIRVSWTKIGKSSKIFTFSDLHDFFTAIYSGDFCQTWFHGSPIPMADSIQALPSRD